MIGEHVSGLFPNRAQWGSIKEFRGTRTYNAWSCMLKRCRNPKDAAWKNYGARGIDYDPRWLKFETFLSDMGECPERMSIERIDNDRGYWPDNCKWATRAEQSRNNRKNVFVVLNGERMCFSDALVSLNFSYQAYYYHWKRTGLTHQEAIDLFAGARKRAVRGHTLKAVP